MTKSFKELEEEFGRETKRIYDRAEARLTEDLEAHFAAEKEKKEKEVKK